MEKLDGFNFVNWSHHQMSFISYQAPIWIRLCNKCTEKLFCSSGISNSILIALDLELDCSSKWVHLLTLFYIAMWRTIKTGKLLICRKMILETSKFFMLSWYKTNLIIWQRSGLDHHWILSPLKAMIFDKLYSLIFTKVRMLTNCSCWWWWYHRYMSSRITSS